MIPDGEYRAVLDRIEDDLAALEVDVGGDLRELVVDPEALPAAARRADAVLDVRVRDGELVDADYDRRTTRRRRRQAQDRFDRLSKRPRQDDDGE
jgi:predicted AlkP superfamily phosphohydrolase/phosphomutase